MTVTVVVHADLPDLTALQSPISQGTDITLTSVPLSRTSSDLSNRELSGLASVSVSCIMQCIKYVGMS